MLGLHQDNLSWVQLLLMSTFFSFAATALSGANLIGKREHHLAKFAHECIVRQQMVYPSFYISLLTATTLRNAQHTALTPMVLTALSLLFLMVGTLLVGMQDDAIGSLQKQLGHAKENFRIGLKQWLAAFRYSVSMFGLSFVLAICLACSSGAIRPK